MDISGKDYSIFRIISGISFLNARFRSHQVTWLQTCLVWASLSITSAEAQSPAQILAPDFKQAVLLSRDMANQPTGWIPNPALGDRPLITISGHPATDIPDFGLKYVNDADGKNHLIVRTLTQSKFYTGSYVNQPDYRIYGQPTTNADWVTTGNDMTRFIQQNGGNSANVVPLLERGLGVQADSKHTAIVEYAVLADNDHLLRPTKNPDISSYSTDPSGYGPKASWAPKPAGMSQTAYDNFVGVPGKSGYYSNWQTQAYDSAPTSNSAFPWTQLGYTLFWGNGSDTLGKVQGMSEFIIPGATSVNLYGIYSPQSYLYTLNKNGAFSHDADAQFGNGFASFKIDGPVDTVWAGHRFQHNVSHDTQAGQENRILIKPGATVTGGQGILISSLNYVVDNQGAIRGVTAKKFGLNQTDNISVLFMGDTSSTFGTPIKNGTNTLINAGEISSPGVAVKVLAGNSRFTQYAGGRLAGGEYALLTASGNDLVNLHGGEISGRIDLGSGTDRLDITGNDEPVHLHFTLDPANASTPSVRVKDQGRGSVHLAANTRFQLSLAGRSLIRNEQRFLLIDTDALTLTPPTTVSSSSPLTPTFPLQNDSHRPMLSFSAHQEGGQLYASAQRDPVYYQTHSGNASLGRALDHLANSARDDLANAIGDLDASADPRLALSWQPQTESARVRTGFTLLALQNQQLSARMAHGQPIPFRTGDALWAQGWAAELHQKNQLQHPGYQARLRGVSLGHERPLPQGSLLGWAVTYAHASLGLTQAKTDIDSYQASLYGQLRSEPIVLDGVLTLAQQRLQSTRRITLSQEQRNAHSHASSHLLSAHLAASYPMTLHAESGWIGASTLSPTASLSAMRQQRRSYRESGAEALNLEVATQTDRLLQSGLGAQLDLPLGGAQQHFNLQLNASWRYDWLNQPATTEARLAGTDASFSTTRPISTRSGGQVGARLRWNIKDTLRVALDYDYSWKKNYTHQSAYLNIGYTF